MGPSIRSCSPLHRDGVLRSAIEDAALCFDWLQEVTLYETTDGKSHLQRFFWFEVLSLTQHEFSWVTKILISAHSLFFARSASGSCECVSLVHRDDRGASKPVHNFSVLPVSLVQTGNCSEWGARTRSEYDLLYLKFETISWFVVIQRYTTDWNHLLFKLASYLTQIKKCRISLDPKYS